MDLLTFSLNRERYAVPVAAVAQIHRAVAITALPGAPRVIEGAINVRGSILPVIDLRRRFGLAARPVALTDILILLRTGARAVAVRADGDAQVLRIPEENIEAPGSVYPHPSFVAGIARLPDGMLLIQDPEGFLSEAESALLDEALAAAEARNSAHAG